MKALFEIEAVGGLLLAERQTVLDNRRAAGWYLFAVTDLFLYFTKAAPLSGSNG